MNIQSAKTSLEKLGFSIQNEDDENFEMAFLVNNHFAVLVSFYEEEVKLSYDFFKDGKGKFSQDYMSIHEVYHELSEITEVKLLKEVSQLLKDFAGLDSLLELHADIKQLEAEIGSEGENEYEVVLTQSYSRTLKVRADDEYDATNYVDGCLIVFTESDYVSGSSSAEVN